MKIAVIDPIANPGGGSRVARALLPAMKKLRPDLDLTFFGNKHGILREGLIDVFQPLQIKIKGLSSVQLSGKDLFNIRGSRHLFTLVQRKFSRFLRPFPYYLSGAVHLELEKVVQGFDAALFTWPFNLRCPHLKCPMAGIFHDYNYKYFFGGQLLVPHLQKFYHAVMPDWLERTTPIVSTRFMKSEVEKFYPDFGHKVQVVPIAPMSEISKIDRKTAQAIIAKRGIQTKYLLCPTHTCVHKNVGPLLNALFLLKQKHPDLVLVLTGAGTQHFNGKACRIGLELDQQPQDVFGLGYVSNEEIDSLISCAAVVVNPSLYEGGNGPGFDAWSKGVPVAMSDIPPFLEHMQEHGVKAGVFNPRSPEDIADKIDQILSYPEKTECAVAESKEAIQRFTWEKTAEQYLQILEAAARV